MRQLRSVAAATALVLVAACDLNTAPNTPSVTDPTKDTYASALGVDLASMTKTTSGLYYKDTKYRRELRRVTTLDLPRPALPAHGTALATA